MAAKPAVVHQLPETPQQRYRRWCRLDAAVTAGAALAAEDQRFWESYPKRTEFVSMRDMEAFFGAAKSV
jgi:hypothetical protein